MVIFKTIELVQVVYYYIGRFNNASTLAECELCSRKLEGLAKELRRRCIDEDSSVFRTLERYGF